jgi:hypothetical protein
MEWIEWVGILISNIVIGILITIYWYSPKIDLIDFELRDRHLGDIGMVKMSIWIVLMILFWWGLFWYEKITKFQHWYPKNIYIDFEHPSKSLIVNS